MSEGSRSSDLPGQGYHIGQHTKRKCGLIWERRNRSSETVVAWRSFPAFHYACDLRYMEDETGEQKGRGREKQIRLLNEFSSNPGRTR
jgi:hypothetical protein